MKISNKTYDILKFVAWAWTPIVTFVTAVIDIWFFDCKYFEQIVGTLAAIEALIGSFTAYSNVKYNKEINTEE